MFTMMNHRLLLIALAVLMFSGCATTPPPPVARTTRKWKRTPVVQVPRPVISDDLSLEGLEADASAVRNPAEASAALNPGVSGKGQDQEISNVGESPEAQAGKDNVMRSIVNIPAEENELVQKWITYFTQKDHERFQRFLDRGEKYRELIANVLEENELPPELFFLAMIESGFNTHANSAAKAKGVWQFMPATGKRYGLEVDSHVDERRDPVRATEAAARYLKDLHNVFGSWHLAMAAYNAGETRIMNSVFRGRSRDFWELARNRVLPEETANYVPKFLAAMTIARDYQKYGFRKPQGESLPDLESAEVPSPVRLSAIAQVTGLSLATLKEANPHLLLDHTPLRSRTYDLWVPADKVELVQNRKNEIAQYVIRSKIPMAVAEAGSASIHIVRRGENLTMIARRYNVSMNYLKQVNGLTVGKIHTGQRLRIGTVTASSRAATPVVAIRDNATASTSLRSKALPTYKVKPGDNLHSIARRFGTTPEVLKRKNDLRRGVLYVGQVIQIVK